MEFDPDSRLWANGAERPPAGGFRFVPLVLRMTGRSKETGNWIREAGGARVPGSHKERFSLRGSTLCVLRGEMALVPGLALGPHQKYPSPWFLSALSADPFVALFL